MTMSAAFSHFEVNPWTWMPTPGMSQPNPYQQYGQAPAPAGLPVGLVVGLLILWGIVRMGGGTRDGVAPRRRKPKRRRALTRTGARRRATRESVPGAFAGLRW
ncbi:MAG: hypothetical protein Q8Q14_08545 [Gemmatimonadales bacterium]|nr:hypothetical protein [Gemmatimonadales bacterium]